MLLATTIFAPTAAAAAPVPVGIADSGWTESHNAGGPDDLMSVWVGRWVKTSGWGGLESAIDKAKANGVPLVVYWYYWGNDIAPTCFDSDGCNGRNLADWDKFTRQIASYAQGRGAGVTIYVVLENEFNKGSVTGDFAPKLDAHLEAKARILGAPSNVKVVAGFGGWGDSAWAKFPKLIAASDVIGFQVMRASTRNSEASYRAADDDIIKWIGVAKKLAPTKGVLLYDLALSSYPDSYWAKVQAETLSSILARRVEYAEKGLVGISYRSVRDNPNMNTKDHYGSAETTWGLKRSDGTAKPAWSVWVKAGGGSTTSSPTTSTTFTPHDGNSWWVQTKVTSSASIAKVCASVDGGACQTLAKQSWGSWAASIHAPSGSKVVFKATSSSGAVATSATYTWPVA